MKISEIMTRNPETIQPNASLQEAARMMSSVDTGVLPVFDGKELVGMITDRDIVIRVVAEGKAVEECTVQDAMTPDVVSVRESDDVMRARQLMTEQQIRRVVVVDEQGMPCGIVALADFAAATDEQQSGEVLREVSQPANKAA